MGRELIGVMLISMSSSTIVIELIMFWIKKNFFVRKAGARTYQGVMLVGAWVIPDAPPPRDKEFDGKCLMR